MSSVGVGGRTRSPWRTAPVRFTGPLLTVAIGAVIELLPAPLRITNPPALFLPVIVWTGFSSGLGPALLAAAIGWTYTAYFFFDPAAPRFFSSDDLRRVVLWAVTMPVTAILVGVLHRRAVDAEAAAGMASLRQEQLKERADAAEVLRESERRLAEAERVAHVGWSEIDLLNGHLTASQEAWRIYGRTPASSAAPDDWRSPESVWISSVHPEDRPRVMEAHTAAVAGGPRLDAEYRIVRPDGDVRTIHVEGDLAVGEDGRPLRLFTVVQDVTELRRAESELRVSEARFRTFVDHATDAFFLHDATGRVLDVNQQACDALGYTRDELIGLRPSAFDADQDAAALATVSARLETGEVLSIDTHHRRRDGTVFPVEVRVRPFWVGQRRFAVSLARDVTERQKADEALRESRERLRLAVEASGLGPWDWDIDTNEVVFSPEWKRQIGYAEDEISGRFEEWERRVHPDDRPVVQRRLKEYLASRERQYAVDFRLQHKDGSYRWIHTRGTALRDANGKPLRMLGCHLDMTDRRRAEQDVRDSHELLQAVIEGTPDAVFVKGRDGRYLMINAAGARFIGRPAEQIIGRIDSDLMASESAERIMERDRRVISSGQPEVFEEAAPATESAADRTFLTTKSAFRDAQGRIGGLIGISRDITELKGLEDQLRHAQKMEAVGRLAGGVAHDFNNLLTVINGCTELVFEGMRPEDPNRELLADVRRSGDRAATLTRQLLAFSRRQVLQPEAVDLDVLLAEMRALLARIIGEDIDVSFVSHVRVAATVDPGQFEQALINLAVNARDAMPNGGSLRIETREPPEHDPALRRGDVRPGPYVLLTVTDSGHGMDESTRSRIFEPFFTTKEPGKGTGLGLAMVYGFVKQSGGHIDVETELGRGTTFKLYLPCSDTSADLESGASAPVAAPRGAETILLVEDEDAVRSLSRLALQASGYTVLEARNGQEGFFVAQQHAGPIHVLVTDVVMPRMSGRQLVELLAPVRPQMRTLYISGYSDEALSFETDTCFLQKPFTPMSLARKVREVLDHGRP
jgi:two-component system, cell cycle sensor histidine kinase and response regulator CckA